MNSSAQGTKQSVSQAVEKWIEKIDSLVLQQKKTVFEIGDSLIAAESELSKTAFQKVVKGSGLKSKQTANNYLRVARSPYLRDPKFFEKLPTGVGALIDLASWSRSELVAAIAEGVINPQSERGRLRAWRSQYLNRFFSDSTAVNKIDPPDAVELGRIMVDGALWSKEKDEKFKEILFELQAHFPDNDFYVATSKGMDSISLYRRMALATKIREAYDAAPELFVDPHFHQIWKARSGMVFYTPEDVAPYIASKDHAELHKRLKFSKSDWELGECGVPNSFACYGVLTKFNVANQKFHVLGA